LLARPSSFVAVGCHLIPNPRDPLGLSCDKWPRGMVQEAVVAPNRQCDVEPLVLCEKEVKKFWLNDSHSHLHKPNCSLLISFQT
jgi:hypothetical protein